MKTAREFFVEKHKNPADDSDKVQIAMMAEYGRYVKEQCKLAQSPQPHTFPTWEEWERFADDQPSDSDVYNFFRDRVQPLEIGREYDFGGESGDSIRGTFKGYSGTYGTFTYIRPIQPDPKQGLIEGLKKLRHWSTSKEWSSPPFADDEYDALINNAIKALEEK